MIFHDHLYDLLSCVYGDNTLFILITFSDFLRNVYRLIASEEKLQVVVDSCIKSREKACAAKCGLEQSVCAGFQYGPENTCCLIGQDAMLNGNRLQAPDWKIWKRI